MSLTATGTSFKLNFKGEEVGYGYSSSLGQVGASEALKSSERVYSN